MSETGAVAQSGVGAGAAAVNSSARSRRHAAASSMVMICAPSTLGCAAPGRSF
jgi:hypothetical protein